ncbi:MAG: hypothetical protein CMK59_11390 [Proteobacteria bacterium]|nr:hypothetical protein [Pseudomonadota bacterium]
MFGRNSFLVFFSGIVLGIVATAVASSTPEGGGFLRPGDLEPQECEGAVSVLLQRKKEALDRRERTIVSRESDLDSAELRMRDQFEELSSLRDEIREQMKAMDEAQNAEVERLTAMFQKMRGKQAAAILEKADEEVAIAVLREMDQGKAGAALAAMNPKTAATLAQKLTEAPALSTSSDDPATAQQ